MATPGESTSRAISRFGSSFSVLLGLLLFARVAYALVLVRHEGYLDIRFWREVSRLLAGGLDAAIAWALLAAAAVELGFAGIPAVRGRLGAWGRWPARILTTVVVSFAVLRSGWSFNRSNLYRAGEAELGVLWWLLLLSAAAIATGWLLWRTRRRPLRAAAVVALVSGAVILDVGAHVIANRAPVGTPGSRPNVVLVSLDTVRADHVGCYGFSRPTTPGLDDLARDATLFETTISAAPWTLPSHASMFTGRYPHLHQTMGLHGRLPSEEVTLAEVLAESGYETAAFTGGGYLNPKFGLLQGFQVREIFDDAPTSQIVSRALGWLAGRGRGRPFYLFVHTYEPHTPYRDHSFARDADAGRIGPVVGLEEIQSLRAGSLNPTDAERRYIRDLYDGDIKASDAALAALWSALRSDGLMDATVAIVTSDHGEELFERSPARSAGHGHSLYDELVRVPLIIRYPGVFSGGRRIGDTVSLVDIAPTVAEIAGVSWPVPLEGRSLVGVGGEGDHAGSERAISEAIRWGVGRRSLRTPTLKFIMPTRSGAAPFELYDLAVDPGERLNVARERSADVARFGRFLRSFGEGAGNGEQADVEEELRRQLHALGYVD